MTHGAVRRVEAHRQKAAFESSPWKLPRPAGSEQVSGEAAGPSLQITARASGAYVPMSTPIIIAQEPILPPGTGVYAGNPERFVSQARAPDRRALIDGIRSDTQRACLAHDGPRMLSRPTRILSVQGSDISRNCISAESPDAREPLLVLSRRLWPIDDAQPDSSSNITSIGSFLGHPMHS